MAIVSVKDLLESGVHFGHRVSRWNPKMEPFIYGKRNLIHIIDLRSTVKGLLRATNFLHRLTADGRDILIVGTKRQAKAVVEGEARRCGMHYVTERWLGGTLTNFETITRRLRRLEELEGMETGGQTSLLTKKELARFNREKRKLLRNLEGIRNMKKLPGAVVIVDPRREHISLKEAYKLGIPTICLIDTDSDPELVDIPIPGNDDAMRSIQVILRHLTEAVISGLKIARTRQGIETKKLEEVRAERGEEESAPAPARGRPRPGTGAKKVVVRRVEGTKPPPAAPAPEAAVETAPAPEAPAPAAEPAPAPEAAAEPAPAPPPAEAAPEATPETPETPVKEE